MSDFDLITDFDKMLSKICDDYCFHKGLRNDCDYCPAIKYRAKLKEYADREEDDLK